jgi:hypothetical protein
MNLGISALREKIFSTFGNLREPHISFYTIPAIIFLLAFIPRVIHLGMGLTIDELSWLTRAPHFTNALLQGNYANTHIVIHPGVTVMWLSGFFMKLFLQP